MCVLMLIWASWGHDLAGFFTWLVVYTISLQDKHIEEVPKNKESKDPADEIEAD